MTVPYTSTVPPSFAGVRYKHVFMLLQVTNAVRFYICPEEMGFKTPPLTHITLVLIMLANAAAFCHGMDGTKQNWEVAINCMTVVLGVYLFNVCVLMYSVYRDFHLKQELLWNYWWDVLLCFHECYVTTAMMAIARAEARYFGTIESLEKTNAEYNAHRPKKQRRRPTKNEDEAILENGYRSRPRYYH